MKSLIRMKSAADVLRGEIARTQEYIQRLNDEVRRIEARASDLESDIVEYEATIENCQHALEALGEPRYVPEPAEKPGV